MFPHIYFFDLKALWFFFFQAFYTLTPVFICTRRGREDSLWVPPGMWVPPPHCGHPLPLVSMAIFVMRYPRRASGTSLRRAPPCRLCMTSTRVCRMAGSISVLYVRCIRAASSAPAPCGDAAQWQLRGPAHESVVKRRLHSAVRHPAEQLSEGVSTYLYHPVSAGQVGPRAWRFLEESVFG